MTIDASHHASTGQDHAGFQQPQPYIPAQNPSLLAFMRAIRYNGLAIWPQQAYDADVLQQRLPGARLLLVNEPRLIQHVLVENHRAYSHTNLMRRVFRPIGGNGLVLATGDEWKHQRATVAPTLAPKMLPTLMRHVDTSVKQVIDALLTQPSASTDLLALTRNLAIGMTARALFSVEIDQYGEAIRALLEVYRTTVSPLGIADILLPPAVPTLRDFHRVLFGRRWRALIDKVMNERQRSPRNGAPRDLFDALASSRDPESDIALTHADLRNQVGTMFFAGQETVGVALFWALYLLSHQPLQQALVEDEVRNIDKDAQWSDALMSRLPYTRAVVSETLRLYPPAWAIVRKCIKADRLGDIDVKPGTQIIVSPWVLHHHRAFWHNPELFEPTRFLAGAPSPARFTYLPFGIGPRVCVGAQFASTELTVALARFLQAFTLSIAERQPVRPLGIGALAPDRSPLIQLAPRAR